MSRWKVAKHYGIWYAIEHGWKRYNAFPNWAEAMAYADQRARTIEVTLPRITGDMEDGMSSWPNLRDVGLSVDHHDEPRLGQLYTMIYDGYSDIGVEAYDLKPLALALLAVAHRKGEA